MLDEAPDVIDFPDLPDEAVFALNDFLEILTTCFQNHYFTQLRRAYYSPPPPDCRPDPPSSARAPDQPLLPLDDPPF